MKRAAVSSPAKQKPRAAQSPRRGMRDLGAVYKGASVVVTGGLGFIGSNLAIRLAELGAQVTIVDSLLPGFGGNIFNIAPVEGQVRVNISDVRDSHSLTALLPGQKFLFNLAAQVSHVGSMTDPLVDLDINVRSQLLLLEACRQHNPTIRIVHVSSRHVYGRAQYLPVDEAHPLAPMDIYSINKLAGEQYYRLYGAVHKLRVSVLRLTNVYGPRQNALDFIGVFLRRAVARQPLLIYGDGSQIRDYTYIDDVCRAMLMMGASDETLGEVFNLGGAEHCSVSNFAQRLSALAHTSVQYVPYPPERAAIEIGDFHADDTKFRLATGWSPRVKLDEGLKATYDYFNDNQDRY